MLLDEAEVAGRLGRVLGVRGEREEEVPGRGRAEPPVDELPDRRGLEPREAN